MTAYFYKKGKAKAKKYLIYAQIAYFKCILEVIKFVCLT